MGGGLLQLVAYGAQDVYLTGNPQITFFKVAYRRHTNFALEAIEQTFNGNPTYGSRVTCQISRNGDLINRMYLQVKVPSGTGTSYVNYYGLRLLNFVEIEIGGQKIDKHYSYWLYVWNELSLPKSKRHGYNQMVGGLGGDAVAGSTLYIPLEFWFCRNIGLALPLIALQYHEVKIKIEFETAAKCLYTPGDTADPTVTAYKLDNPNLWVDYIYLDTDERRKFAQLSHEYLIEQLQFTGQETLNSNGSRLKLNFNHPCKELVWVAKNNKYASQWYNYTFNTKYTNAGGFLSTNITNAAIVDSNLPIGGFNELNTSNFLVSSNVLGASVTSVSFNNYLQDSYIPYSDVSGPQLIVNPFETCLLQLNGNDRFNVRDGSYFNLVQPYQHHTNIPLNRGINVYSFALKPEEHQPSGTLNMSRIDTAILDVKPRSISGTLDANINVYAVNYNVLRILSGMGGLAYSN